MGVGRPAHRILRRQGAVAEVVIDTSVWNGGARVGVRFCTNRVHGSIDASRARKGFIGCGTHSMQVSNPGVGSRCRGWAAAEAHGTAQQEGREAGRANVMFCGVGGRWEAVGSPLGADSGDADWPVAVGRRRGARAAILGLPGPLGAPPPHRPSNWRQRPTASRRLAARSATPPALETTPSRRTRPARPTRPAPSSPTPALGSGHDWRRAVL